MSKGIDIRVRYIYEYKIYSVMGSIAIIDRIGIGSEKEDRVTNGGSGWGRDDPNP